MGKWLYCKVDLQVSVYGVSGRDSCYQRFKGLRHLHIWARICKGLVCFGLMANGCHMDDGCTKIVAISMKHIKRQLESGVREWPLILTGRE